MKHFLSQMKTVGGSGQLKVPEYLQAFEYKEKPNIRGTVTKILNGTFDQKADEQKLDKLMETTKRQLIKGGPMSPRELRQFPGEEAYLEHLEKTSDYIMPRENLYFSDHEKYLQ